MKKLRILICMLLAFTACTILAAADFHAGVEVDREVSGVITVTVEDSDVLHSQVPKLSLACDFPYAKITRNGTRISCTLENGTVVFPVAQGGVYRIERSETPVPEEVAPDNSGSDASSGGGSVSGGTTTTTTGANGVTGTTTKDKTGAVTEVSAKIPASAVQAAAKENKPVTLPVELEVTEAAKAPVVKIDVPADGAKVEIPVKNVTFGTVVVIVDKDGKETVVPTTGMTEAGVVVQLPSDAMVKVIDNSKDFGDVPANSTFEDVIDFVSARGLFNGTSDNTFTPNAPTTRGQVMTVLARAAGVDTAVAPIQTGMNWAKEQGISDGTNAGGSITRQQLAVMLWRYAGEPASDHEIGAYNDDHMIGDYAAAAMRWAIENGIMGGYTDGSLKPYANATRAHVAAMVARFIQYMN